MVSSFPPESGGDSWVGSSAESLPVGDVLSWVVRPDAGALVTFCGTVRDHSEGRPGVSALEYEAYEEQVNPCLARVAVAARERWPDLKRIAMLHRIGRLEVTEVSVIVAVSAPHRGEAFEAARYCIDTLKATVPIWKREIWQDGSDWGLCSHDIAEVERVHDLSR